MKPLVVIPARGGSKRLPDKNILSLGGKPLILHTTDFARQHFPDDQICVSTDDDRIIEIVESSGLKVFFKRPQDLATDISSTQDVLIHASDYYENVLGLLHDVVILLQPTSPFRKASDLKIGLQVYNESRIDMVVSVVETKSNPYFVLFEEDKNGFLYKCKQGNFSRSQDAPKVWEYNGSMYFINKTSLLNMPISSFQKVKKIEIDEYHSLDIDTSIDFEFANYLLEKKKI